MKKIQLILLLVLCSTRLLLAQAPPPPGPAAVHAVGRDSICHGDTTSLVAIDTTLRGTMHFTWSPSTALSCDTCDSVRAYPTVTTSYTLIGRDSLKSDTSTVTIVVDTLVAGVNVFVNGDTSYRYFDTSIYLIHTFCPFLTAKAPTIFNFLLAFPTNGGGSPVYEWFLNGQSTGIVSDTFIIGQMLGSSRDTLYKYISNPPYYSLLTCQMTSSLTSCIQNRVAISLADTLTEINCPVGGGINQISFENEVAISPNPGNGIFSLSVSQSSQQMTIELWNLQGQLLYNEQRKQESAFNKQYNFSNLAKGVYLLKVTTENGAVVKRVVIQ